MTERWTRQEPFTTRVGRGQLLRLREQTVAFSHNDAALGTTSKQSRNILGTACRIGSGVAGRDRKEVVKNSRLMQARDKRDRALLRANALRSAIWGSDVVFGFRQLAHAEWSPLHAASLR